MSRPPPPSGPPDGRSDAHNGDGSTRARAGVPGDTRADRRADGEAHSLADRRADGEAHSLANSRADAPPAWRRKVRYHHGDLASSALRRAREIVAAHGPSALTLRGLARDLGVSATALVHHYGNLEGLRAAVAQAVLEDIEAAARAPGSAVRPTRDLAAAWVEFAARNPNLYRLASGDPWHRSSARPTGHYGMIRVPSPRRSLETTLAPRCRRGERDRARVLAVAVHGLALARIDGVADVLVSRELERAVAAFG